MQSGSLVICPIEVQEPEIVIGLLGVNISAYDRLCVILQSNFFIASFSIAIGIVEFAIRILQVFEQSFIHFSTFMFANLIPACSIYF